MNQNEIFLTAEVETGYPARTDSMEQFQTVSETLSTEQADQETGTTAQTVQTFRWNKITTWPPDIVICLIVAGTALCVLRFRRTQFELWYGKAGYLYGNILLILASLFVLCLFVFRGCTGEF